MIDLESNLRWQTLFEVFFLRFYWNRLDIQKKIFNQSDTGQDRLSPRLSYRLCIKVALKTSRRSSICPVSWVVKTNFSNGQLNIRLLSQKDLPVFSSALGKGFLDQKAEKLQSISGDFPADPESNQSGGLILGAVSFRKAKFISSLTFY